MSCDIRLQCFRDGEPAGIPWTALLLLFPVQTAESTPELWRIRYDEDNSCEIALSPLPLNESFIQSLCVHRPCRDDRLWQALFTVLRMGHAILYFSGGAQPLAADESAAAHLPPGMVEALGFPRCIKSGLEIRQVVENAIGGCPG
jgi:hypothetical protein